MRKMALITALLILGISTRFLPHPANFTAIGAVAMFGGLYLPKRWAVIAPIMMMSASDIFIGFYDWRMMASVYLSFALMSWIGLKVRNNKKMSTVLGGTIIGSLLFFLITNWAVWAFGAMYSHSLQGLFESYVMALPFFRNSLMGDIFYVSLLAGIAELVVVRLGAASKAPNNIAVAP